MNKFPGTLALFKNIYFFEENVEKKTKAFHVHTGNFSGKFSPPPPPNSHFPSLLSLLECVHKALRPGMTD